MRHPMQVPVARPIVLGVLMSLALAGCGGGGGGGSAPAGDIAVTAANRDALTRAAMVGLAGGLSIEGFTQAGGGAAALGTQLRALSASAARKRPAALTTPVVENCAVSGTSSSWFDDINGNGGLDLNEPVTIAYSACRDDLQAPDLEFNGSLVFAITALRNSGATASVTAQAYTTTWTGHSVRLDGGFSMALDDTSPTTGQLAIGVGNSLVMQVATPQWADRLTLQAGYQSVMSIDTSALSTSTTASGTVRSELAGGYVTTRTLQPLVQFSSDPYPRSGRVEVIGRTGSLQATVQSTSLVQIDLDADGNGVYEATTTLGWDEIL